MSKPFKLSASLYGHSLDVRSVAVSEKSSIISGSRDKTAKLWVPSHLNSEYKNLQTYRDQKNFVVAVIYLEPSSDYPEGLIITGGNDSTICLYKPSEPFASLVLKEHTNTVSCLNSISSSSSGFLSGSWDCSAKLWLLEKSNQAAVTFSGHTAAVWAVIQLKDTRIVTASADKLIGIWNMEGNRLGTFSGHTDCVRGLLDLPELHQFVSVSNDASVRVWNYLGENIDTYFGHTNYIYSIARCRAGGENCFVTSDEDRTVRFWQNGVNTETFHVPAQSVWSVACLSNGDIVAGASDGVVRIFTQNESRFAEAKTLKEFDEEVEAQNAQSSREIGGVKVTDLPGPEVLYEPGKKPGQMKMIREGSNVVAYTWVDGENGHWEKVGLVLGSTDKTDKDKTMYEGQAYDFVFSVDVEDGKPPLKLPYNKGEDVYSAANKFLAKNVLPSSYREQIVDFILKNSQENYVPPPTGFVDPFTGGSRYTPSSTSASQGFAGTNFDPFTGGSSYSTSIGGPSTSSIAVAPVRNFFPITAYRTFEMGDPNVILSKLKEFSGQLTDDSYNSLDGVIQLCNGPSDDSAAFDNLFRLLNWSDRIVFPAIDVIRMAVRHQTNNAMICGPNNGAEIMKKLSCFISTTANVSNVIVSLRTLCNMFCHPTGEDLVIEHRFELVENVTSLGMLNKNGQVALATLLLNLTVGCVKKRDEVGISVLANVIPDILTKITDPESQFRCYVALGTLLSTSQREEVKIKITSNSSFLGSLQLHLLAAANELEQKTRNCAAQVQDILGVTF